MVILCISSVIVMLIRLMYIQCHLVLGYRTWLHRCRGPGIRPLTNPYSAVMSDEGYIFVTDFKNYRVSMFTSEGRLVKHIITYDVPYYEGTDRPKYLSVRGKYLWVATTKGRLTRYIL